MNQDEVTINEYENVNNELDASSDSSVDKKPEEPKKVLKNIVKVTLSNIFTLLSGILVGFFIPKLMTNGDSTAEYGYYKIFTLYLGYVGLFHFGFIDGIYLLFGGKSYNDLDKTRFRTYSKFFIVFQLIISAIITCVVLCFVSDNYGFIFVFIGINLLAENVTMYYQIISQITGRFNELSLRNIVKSSLTIITVIVLLVLFKTNVIDYLQFKSYVILVSIISFILSLWYIITYRDITFGESAKLKDELPSIKKFFIVGIPLLIANLVVNLILNIDRQFVSILYDQETYASYAFGYNMLNLITTATSAISVVLYPTLKKLNFERLNKNYNIFISIIAIFVSFCIIAYFPLNFIVTTWLDKYIESLAILRIIMPGIILSSAISMIMLNYYKTLGKSRSYFIISIVVLALSFVLNLLAYIIYKKPIVISIASVIVMFIWYLIAEFVLIRKWNTNRCWKLSTYKNLLYIILIITAFYLITFFIENIFVGCLIYFLVYLLITLVFYFKLIKSKFKIKQ